MGFRNQALILLIVWAAVAASGHAGRLIHVLFFLMLASLLFFHASLFYHTITSGNGEH